MYTDMVIIDGPPRLKARMTSVKSERRKGQQYKKQQERVKRTVIEHAPNTKNYDNRATFQTPAERVTGAVHDAKVLKYNNTAAHRRR